MSTITTPRPARVRYTVGSVIEQLRTTEPYDAYFGSLTPRDIIDWLPSQKRGKLANKRPSQIRESDRITKGQVDLIHAIALALLEIQQALESDRYYLGSWALDTKSFVRHPKDNNLRIERRLMVEELSDYFLEIIARRSEANPRTGRNLLGLRHYVYASACQHVAQTSQREMRQAMGNSNTRVAAFPRLCNACVGLRIQLLDAVPGAATGASVCSFCLQPTFDAGQEGTSQDSHDRSRAALWENSISEVLNLVLLPRRLRPEHAPRHPKHIALVNDFGKFQEWVLDEEEHFGALRSQMPAEAARLQQEMIERRRARAAKLGIQLDNRNYPVRPREA